MVAQVTYGETPAIGFNGMLAQEFSLRQIDSGLVEAVAGIGLGIALAYGTADGQYIAAVADGKVAGISIYSGSSETPADGVFVYPDKSQLPVLKSGRYYAIANAAHAIDAEVAFDPATGKVGATVGTVTTQPFGKSITSAEADGDLIVVEVKELYQFV